MRTVAAGLAYRTFIIFMKLDPRPRRCRTAHKLFHSSWSKAFIASRDNTAQGDDKLFFELII